jgi:hypothetical protein
MSSTGMRRLKIEGVLIEKAKTGETSERRFLFARILPFCERHIVAI